jgi:hypothetical protein
VSKGAAGATRPWWSRADETATEFAQVADPIIDALPPEARQTLSAVWQERGGSELRVAAGFSAVAMQLCEHGSDQSVIELVTRAVRDEVHHAEISVQMAARYGNRDVEWPGPQPVQVPIFASTEGQLRATLFVVAMCCINETLACSVLERQLSQVKPVLVRAAAQTILSDEIDHARAGWAHIASKHVTPAIKREVARWLPRMLEARLAELVEIDQPFPGEEYPEHGVLTRKIRRDAIASTLRDAVFPGFARAGIEPTHAVEWAAKAFPF